MYFIYFIVSFFYLTVSYVGYRIVFEWIEFLSFENLLKIFEDKINKNRRYKYCWDYIERLEFVRWISMCGLMLYVY